MDTQNKYWISVIVYNVGIQAYVENNSKCVMQSLYEIYGMLSECGRKTSCLIYKMVVPASGVRDEDETSRCIWKSLSRRETGVNTWCMSIFITGSHILERPCLTRYHTHSTHRTCQWIQPTMFLPVTPCFQPVTENCSM